MKKSLALTIPLVTFVACTVLAEIFLAVFAPVSDPYRQYKYFSLNQFIRSEFPVNYQVTTEAERGLPGVKGRNRFSTNNMGFRGDDLVTPKPKDEFRIFMIGGSTTECLYLDDADSIDAVLQKALQSRVTPARSFKVYNAGKSGDASDDHISMLVHRIVHLEPDLIIVFAGVNDLLRSLSNHDYLHYLSRKTALDKYPFLFLLATEFQIPRRFYYLLKGLSATEREVLETITLRSDYRERIALRKSARVSEDKPRTDTTAYAKNLKTLYGVAKVHGSRFVFMTQPSTWNSSIDPEIKNWHWLLNRGGIAYREDSMDEALESFNDAMRRISEEHGVPLYDLARSMPKSSEFFYDDVHFNVKGSDTAAKRLSKYIIQKSLIPGL